eukprot:242357-Prorocentrum_minimum.AAC.2
MAHFRYTQCTSRVGCGKYPGVAAGLGDVHGTAVEVQRRGRRGWYNLWSCKGCKGCKGRRGRVSEEWGASVFTLERGEPHGGVDAGAVLDDTRGGALPGPP